MPIKATGSIIQGQKIRLDGNSFIDCTFTQCEMIYTADGKPITMNGCQFIDCNWTFEGNAADTIEFLAILYRLGAVELVENTFDQIRGRGPKKIEPEGAQ